MKNLLTTLVFSLVFCCPSAYAVEYQSLQEIRQQATAFIQNEIGTEHKADITVSALDARLRLQKCASALNITPANGQALSGKTTLAVKCTDPNWTLMVPARIDVYLPVFIANRPIARGEILKAGDISQVTRKVSLLPGGYVSDQEQLLGYKAKRFLRQGMVIPPSALTLPTVVNRGQIVTLLAKSGGLVVRMKGEAMADGVMNQSIRVKNLSSRRIVEGIVVEGGTVQVKM